MTLADYSSPATSRWADQTPPTAGVADETDEWYGVQQVAWNSSTQGTPPQKKALFERNPLTDAPRRLVPTGQLFMAIP